MDKLNKRDHLWLAEKARYIGDYLIIDHVDVFEKLLEMQTEIERLQDALAVAHNAKKDTCMCGSPMDSHSICDNHAPVSEFDYFIGTLKE